MIEIFQYDFIVNDISKKKDDGVIFLSSKIDLIGAFTLC